MVQHLHWKLTQVFFSVCAVQIFLRWRGAFDGSFSSLHVSCLDFSFCSRTPARRISGIVLTAYFVADLPPWYLVLIAPFMVFYPSKAWLCLQAAMVFTFPVMAVDYKTGIFQEIQWLKLLEYLPFLGLFARYLIERRFRKGELPNQLYYMRYYYSK